MPGTYPSSNMGTPTPYDSSYCAGGMGNLQDILSTSLTPQKAQQAGAYFQQYYSSLLSQIQSVGKNPVGLAALGRQYLTQLQAKKSYQYK
jgi:hypothetical protein